MLLHYFLAWILHDKKSVKIFCSSVCNVSLIFLQLSLRLSLYPWFPVVWKWCVYTCGFCFVSGTYLSWDFLRFFNLWFNVFCYFYEFLGVMSSNVSSIDCFPFSFPSRIPACWTVWYFPTVLECSFPLFISYIFFFAFQFGDFCGPYLQAHSLSLSYGESAEVLSSKIPYF